MGNEFVTLCIHCSLQNESDGGVVSESLDVHLLVENGSIIEEILSSYELLHLSNPDQFLYRVIDGDNVCAGGTEHILLILLEKNFFVVNGISSEDETFFVS